LLRDGQRRNVPLDWRCIRAVLKYWALSAAFATLLAGCGESQPSIAAPNLSAQTRAPVPHVDRGESWTLPEATSEDLLYIAGHEDVRVFTYPAIKFVGRLRPLLEPSGAHTECTDSAGDVFITDHSNVDMYEHGKARVKRTLTYPGSSAVACSSDPTTGNLAVTYQLGSASYVGVYQRAMGTPTLYQTSNLNLAFCGYDPQGNLFADGTAASSGTFGFVELSKGSDRLNTIAVDQTLQSPGSVQWDGTYMTVGDNKAQIIYRFTISGSQGTVVGTTQLDGVPGSGLQWWIAGNTVISTYWRPTHMFFWSYPAGGNPVSKHAHAGLYPDGVVVSVASTHRR